MLPQTVINDSRTTGERPLPLLDKPDNPPGPGDVDRETSMDVSEGNSNEAAHGGGTEVDSSKKTRRTLERPTSTTFSFSHSTHTLHGHTVDEERRRKKPKTSEYDNNPSVTQLTNPNLSKDDPDTWTAGIAELANLLSTTVAQGISTGQESFEIPNIRQRLVSIHHILGETQKTIEIALHGNHSPNPHGNQTPYILQALRDLSDQVRALKGEKKRAERGPPTSWADDFPPLPPNPQENTAQAKTASLTNANKPAINPNASKPTPTRTQQDKPSKVQEGSRTLLTKQAPRTGGLRYVVRFRGNPPPAHERLTSERAVRRINARLESLATAKGKVSVVAVVPKPNGNYIVTFSHKNNPREVEAHKNQLLQVLAPDRESAVVSRDEPWVRVIAHNISLRDDMQQPRTSDSMLKTIRLNPVLDGVEITQGPRWLVPPAQLGEKTASAVTFAFLDPNQTILPSLLDGPFHMFGAPVRVAQWQERVKHQQCKKCWKTTHGTSGCRQRVPTCRLCGKKGAENGHATHCEECKGSTAESVVCTHISCANCLARDHCADDPRCPYLQNHLKSKPSRRNTMMIDL
jgi:hypothetical protein